MTPTLLRRTWSEQIGIYTTLWCLYIILTNCSTGENEGNETFTQVHTQDSKEAEGPQALLNLSTEDLSGFF